MQAAQLQTNPDQFGTNERDAALFQLLQITQDLTAVLREETSAITHGKATLVKTLTPRKAELSKTYQDAINHLKSHTSPPHAASEDIRLAVRAATQNFQAEMARNQAALKRQMDLGQSMLKVISTEVERQKPRVSTYGNPAYRQAAMRQGPTTIALNQTI